MDKIKSLYEVKFGHSFAEEAADKDGMEFTVTRGSPPSMSVLEQTLGEIKSMCKEKFGHSITEEVVQKDGIKFILTHVALPSISSLEQALEEIKSMYEEQFGHSVAEDVVEKDGIERQPVFGAIHRGNLCLVTRLLRNGTGTCRHSYFAERELTLASLVPMVQHLCCTSGRTCRGCAIPLRSKT